MHFLISLALTYALSYGAKKLRDLTAKPPKIPEFRGPTATEGRKSPIVYGTVLIDRPNVVWWGDLISTNFEQEPAPGATMRQWFIGMQLTLCRGEVDKITNLWVDDKRFYRYKTNYYDTPVYDLLWDAEAEEQSVEVRFEDSFSSWALDGGYYANVTAHLGSLTQAVDTYLDQFPALDPLPAYRDNCYLVWKGWSSLMPVQQDVLSGLVDIIRHSGGVGTATSVRSFSAEVVRITKVNPLGLAAPQRDVGTGGANANPMNVAYDVLTNNQTLNESASTIDVPNFTTQATTLATEGNGISMLVEEGQTAASVRDSIEKQINGFINKNPRTGKWTCKLARADYTIGALPLVDRTNAKLLRFRRTTWQGTTNQVNIQFPSFDTANATWRPVTWARAHDIANYEIQRRYVPVDLVFPGLRDPALAPKLAARELRARNRPLADAELLCDRTVSHLQPGDVIRLSWDRGFTITDLPMRVIKVDYGDQGGGVTLSVVEDVFGAEIAVQGNPGGSGWAYPSVTPVAIPTAEGQAQEVPYAVAAHFGAPDTFLDRVWYGAPLQTAESYHKFYAREGSDPYALEGSSSGAVYPFVFLGTLNATLAANTAQPHATPSEDVTVNNLDYPGAVSTITKTLDELGEDLDHLILIDSELMLARDIEKVDATTYRLKRVYRGAFDTARRSHASSSNVFLFALGEDLRIGDSSHTQGANTNAQFRSVTISGELSEASSNTETVALNHRGRRPHPPTDLNIEATRYPTSTVSLDSTTALGSGSDQVGVDVSWLRRDYRTLDQVDNALGVTQASFPSATSTEYRIVTTEAPNNTPDVLVTGAWDATGAASQVVTRTSLLAENDGVTPTAAAEDLRVEVQTRHTYLSVVREALQHERWDFEVSSALESLENTGARAQSVTSLPFTASATGTYTFTIGTSFLSSGILEANINGGTFTTVIATSGTTGTLAGVVATDLVRWRHTQPTNGDNTHLRIQDPSAVDEAYGICLM
jgi:hypothetical protein